MSEFTQTSRTRLRLYREFGSYDKTTIYNYIDAAHLCHVSATIDGSPYIQATRHWRIDDKLYIHGAVKNKMVQALRKGAEACLAFSLFDGYALTRSAFNHAVLYRSVIAYSEGVFIEDLEQRRSLLKTFIESVEVGRWATIRQPTVEELKMTGVVEFTLAEVSAKALQQEVTPLIFPGGELEAEQDAGVSPWTGIVPFTLVEGDRIHSKNVVAEPGN